MQATGLLIHNVFVNDNKPPHHYIVKDLNGNYEAGLISLYFAEEEPPKTLVRGEKYYIGSDEKNFPDSTYRGWDKPYLQFQCSKKNS
ncbi:MAG: hypothetical protein HC799_19905 [Limnothrix sp. RL_2_0]|nr:hypothetical protein [Limnothrix sp. RL_2_0]